MKPHGPPEGFRLELLVKEHNRESFTCGSEPLDLYLRTQAGQQMRKRVAAVYVLVQSDTEAIAGYYTLSSASVDAGQLPDPLKKQLPNYAMLPATLLGRLAVDLTFRGQRLGEWLLLDALFKAWQASESVASLMVLVDAKDQSASAFYQHYGFIPFRNHPKRLFLSMQDVARL